MYWPACCLAGVAPTSHPVFKSWLMSPAFEAAIATTVPTVRTAAIAPGPVQPWYANTVATPSSVTSVMPDVGCDDTPTIPTMRAATATNRSPKIPTPAAQIARCSGVSALPNTPGTSAATTITNVTPTTITAGDRSRSVSATSAWATRARDPVRSLNTADSAAHMVGRPAMTVRIPAVATAPAPMYRT